ncbi:hypothetical protein NLI96_g4622 [Meripilus lineatus]|uniref:Cytochrome P450 n=1 Tax=Meripilus lineatus TaxID=2056292 RepID=A0AAD5V4J1_9APHY|nr:hypothetical protein NLI96_g4622 [Physisporinus lineatus]
MKRSISGQRYTVWPMDIVSDYYLPLIVKIGDVMRLNVLQKTIIVLSSEKAANDLLDKRSGIYSDRPRFPMLEIFSASVLMEIAYGQHVVSDDDPYLQIANRLNTFIADVGMQGTHPVDVFPILQKLPPWFPGAWFIRYARDILPEFLQMQRYGFDQVREQMAKGTAKTSFLSLNLEDLSGEGEETEEELKRLELSSFHLYGGESNTESRMDTCHLYGSPFKAGGETTRSSIHTMFLAILLNPEAQKKAQEEIDKVIGSSRLPDFSDRESLPFVECLMYEILRWRPAAPLGLPHRLMCDDEYRGMLIPKGSTVITNIRSMTLDESTHRDPYDFFPERFLPQPLGFGEPRPTYVFGFGRRYLAESSTWIVLATLLAVFDISPAKDEEGNDIVPSGEFHTSLTSHPVPFECTIRPRSEVAKTLVIQ